MQCLINFKAEEFACCLSSDLHVSFYFVGDQGCHKRWNGTKIHKTLFSPQVHCFSFLFLSKLK